jgi:hypothetical protein
MKKIFILLSFMSTCVFAQISRTDSLLVDITDSLEKPVLLPEKMIITQRWIWGERGLIRNWRPLTKENRQQEFKIRRAMATTHQITGLLTLAGFVAQGIVGSQLYSNYSDDLRSTHKNIAKGINISYGITTALVLTCPPAIVHRKGFSSAKAHRILAAVHLLGMITTNILAHQVKYNPDLKPYHRAAALTTFGAYTISIIAFRFK